MDALGADFTIACPAFPANQRTIYKGYLFVGDVLLNESGMRDHPLTPMTDANAVLQGQAKRRVGLVDYAIVPEVHLPSSSAVPRCAEKLRLRRGRRRIRRRPRATRCRLRRLSSDHGGLGPCARATTEFPEPGFLSEDVRADALPAVEGLRAVIAGSCSNATQS